MNRKTVIQTTVKVTPDPTPDAGCSFSKCVESILTFSKKAGILLYRLLAYLYKGRPLS